MSRGWAVMIAILIGALGVWLARWEAGGKVPPGAPALTELERYVDWLERGGVRGFVGEVGWPTGAHASDWNDLAARWYEAADDAGLEVTYWATGEWWGQDYPLSAYLPAQHGGPLAQPSTQALVLEAQPPPLRGIVVSGGEFGHTPETEATSAFSNRAPGVYDRDWHYDGQASFDYLAGRGMRVVKLPFRWERIQPRLGEPLEHVELQRLRAAVRRAGRAGLRVIIEPHNFGSYYQQEAGPGRRTTIGSEDLPDEMFADLWTRLSMAFRDEPTIHAYALMAEPAQLPAVGGQSPATLWERSSQVAVDAIRRTGDDTLVLVPGYDWSSLARWSINHPSPWIDDPAGNIRYDAHHYWDEDGSGSYRSG